MFLCDSDSRSKAAKRDLFPDRHVPSDLHVSIRVIHSSSGCLCCAICTARVTANSCANTTTMTCALIHKVLKPLTYTRLDHHSRNSHPFLLPCVLIMTFGRWLNSTNRGGDYVVVQTSRNTRGPLNTGQRALNSDYSHSMQSVSHPFSLSVVSQFKINSAQSVQLIQSLHTHVCARPFKSVCARVCAHMCICMCVHACAPRAETRPS